ncbi:MAG: hypothetical protein R3D02_09840 [Hyphomicrobiales bacterium]
MLTLLVVETTVAITAFRSHMTTMTERYLKMIETAVVISIDPLRAPTVRDMEFIGRRLVMQQVVAGGFILDDNNRTAGQFGIQLPDLGLVEAPSQHASMTSADGAYLDLRFNGTRQGLGYDLVVRIDRQPLKALALSDVYEKTAITVLLYALGLLLVFVAVLHYAARPLAKMRDGVRAAFADFEHPEKYVFNWSRRDEIGELANSIDRLLRNLSSSRQDQTEATRTFLAHGPVPVITLRAGHSLEFANPAALELFGKEGLGDLIASQWPVVVVPTVTGDSERHVGEILDDSRNMRIVNVKTTKGLRQVQMSHIRHRAHLEERSLTVVQFLDVTRFVQATKRFKDQYEKAELERRRLTIANSYQAFRLAGLSRDMKDEGHEPELNSDEEDVITQWPVRFVRTWHAKAKSSGLVSARIDIDELPGVAIPSYLFYEAIDRIFHVLLSAIGHPGADVAVNTFTDGKQVEFSFAAKSKHGDANTVDALIGVQEAHLRSWLSAIGGTFTAIDIHGPVITATVKFPGIGADQTRRAPARAV